MAAHGALGARAGRARRLLPPAAQAGRPPHASPTTCGGAGTRGRGSCSRASTPAAGRATATRSPSCPGPVDWSQLLDNPAFMAEYHDILAEFESYMANGADHWFQRRHARELEGPIAYFCAEYGLHESLGIYSGGLGVLAGDHMKAASDMALPFDRRRAALPQGLLPPDDRRRRPPGARLPRLRAVAPADPARRSTRSASRSRSASRCPGASCSPPCGWSRSAACRCCCSTPTSPTTTTRTGRSRTSSTCAAARCACTRSSCSASAACGRCGRWASSPPPGTSTRATRRSCSPSGRASWSRPA